MYSRDSDILQTIYRNTAANVRVHEITKKFTIELIADSFDKVETMLK